MVVLLAVEPGHDSPYEQADRAPLLLRSEAPPLLAAEPDFADTDEKK